MSITQIVLIVSTIMMIVGDRMGFYVLTNFGLGLLILTILYPSLKKLINKRYKDK